MNKLLNVVGALPFLVAVFLNTVVDLGHKIVIQNTIFKVYDGSEQVYLTAIVNSLILLPFILMFSVAGFVTDKYPKSTVMRGAAWAAVALTIAITFFYMLGWFWAAFAMTFLLAVQSAFYSPAKYGYIKALFGKENLAAGNGMVQAVSIVGILSGTLIFSVLFESWYPTEALSKGAILSSLVPVGFILIGTSIIELIMMYRLPKLERVDQEQQFDIKAYARGALAKKNLRFILSNQVIFLSIIGMATFWSIGQVMLAAFPAFAKAQTGVTNTIVIQAILAASGLGIAVGSIIAARFSRNYIETGLVPVGAAGIALGLFILPTLDNHLLMGLNFFFIGCMGGLVIVPLNAIIQFNAGVDNIGRVLASSNWVQNVAMLSFLIITVIFSLLEIESKQLLVLIAVVAVLGFAFTVYKLPQVLVRFLLSYLMNSRYKVDVEGMKNIPSNGGVLLLGNHISWIDWAIVQIACPRPVRFVMIRSIYERWYINWFFRLFGTIPIQPGASSAESLEKITQLLNAGEVVCLFPEGTISRNGHLSEFKRGYEKSAKAANDDVVIIPFYIRGLWGSQFSRSSDKQKSLPLKGLRRELLVAFGERLDKHTDAEVLKRRVFDLSISAWQSFAKKMPTLPHAWIDTVKANSAATAIADTLVGESLSAARTLTAAAMFSKRIASISTEQNVGLLLPTSAGGVIANMAALLAGKTIVNLNYTASSGAVASAIQQAEIKTVYTSKRFIAKLQQRGIDLQLDHVQLVYLEELKETIGKVESIFTLLMVKLLPASLLKLCFCQKQGSEQTAAILFSSGSEGLPKGICLSHQNLIANVKQVAEVLNAEGDDIVMASLPLFHAFGLTATQFMPLIQGLPMVCHADPTDAVGVGKAVAKYRATILFGTSTFLRLYTRDKKVQPLMFESVRMAVSGAEKLNQDVRSTFKLKFGKEIYEGYGATETSPVSSVNLPDVLDTRYWKVQVGAKPGSVGMPLPGTSFKIVNPENFVELPAGEDGMILIGGPQVMQGYIHDTEKASQVIKEIDGIRWYVTGDKGHLDNDGFLFIVDRYSRFAKLGGEMVSLRAVESAVRNSLHTQSGDEVIDVVAVAVPDNKKGERIILLSEQALVLSDLKKAMLAAACNPLLIPAKTVQIETLPKLGSGKTDFAKAKLLATNDAADK